jgi:hypothetical protein
LDACQPGQLPRADRLTQSSVVCIVMITQEDVVGRHEGHVEAQSACHSHINNAFVRFVSGADHVAEIGVLIRRSRRSGTNAGTKAK